MEDESAVAVGVAGDAGLNEFAALVGIQAAGATAGIRPRQDVVASAEGQVRWGTAC